MRPAAHCPATRKAHQPLTSAVAVGRGRRNRSQAPSSRPRNRPQEPRAGAPYLLFLPPPLAPMRSGSAGAGAAVGAVVGAGAAVGTGFGGSDLTFCTCFWVTGFETAGAGVVRVLASLLVLVRPFALPRLPGGSNRLAGPSGLAFLV